MFHMISFYNQMINIHQKVTKFSHQDEHNLSQISSQQRQEKKQKLPDDVKHTYIEAVLILSERKTGLEPATFGLGSQRSTS